MRGKKHWVLNPEWALIATAFCACIGAAWPLSISAAESNPHQLLFAQNLKIEERLGKLRKNPHSTMAFKSSIQSYLRQDQKNTEELLQFNNDLKAEHNLGPGLNSSALIGINFSSGSSQGFIDQVERRQGLFVKQAELDWSAQPWLGVSVGVLPTSFVYADNFIKGAAFPTIKQTLSWQRKFLTLKQINTQSIVTSTVLNTKTAAKESTPYFFSNSLFGEWDDPNLDVKVMGTYFHFQDLTSVIAYDSQFLGNTTLPFGQYHKFVYEYYGYNFGASANSLHFYPIGLELKWSVTQNIAAPPGRDKAQSLCLAGYYQITPLLKANASVERFVTQSDASPAYFNSSLLGHSNREGYALRGQLDFLKYELALGFTFADARLLSPRIHQFNERRALLTLETHYVEF